MNAAAHKATVIATPRGDTAMRPMPGDLPARVCRWARLASNVKGIGRWLRCGPGMAAPGGRQFKSSFDDHFHHSSQPAKVDRIPIRPFAVDALGCFENLGYVAEARMVQECGETCAAATAFADVGVAIAPAAKAADRVIAVHDPQRVESARILPALEHLRGLG